MYHGLRGECLLSSEVGYIDICLLFLIFVAFLDVAYIGVVVATA
jgi:hypothetical protein